MKAGGLLSTLQIINRLLRETNATHPEIAADISSKITENEHWIKKVNEKVTKCSINPKDTSRSHKLRVTAKKALYPFHRDTLSTVIS
ncbi:hypothetical protein BJX68DRAFT_248830 [Aspergillus pseudodeflectus]|uniref:Uncharacterized protein n=1 Tax=Aspergillus pseudodeflectus TaxID=176178 RepID=A0ABR4JEK6_9EURO